MKPENAVRLDRSVGRLVYWLHTRAYQATNGRIGHRSPLGPILLLTTTGRRSGRPRVAPLLYMADGDAFVVVGSNAGRDAPPAWWLNLRSDPSCTVQAGARTFEARAELVEGPARDELWERLTAFYKGWAHYQTLTDRPLPIVVLRPSAEDHSGSEG